MSSILLVDDDPDIREAVQLLLEDEGYEVSCAGNGKEALAALQHGLGPSVILLDLMMPVMSGWELRERMLRDASLASIPIIVVTGDPMAAQRAAGLEPAGFLRKPFEAAALVDVVKRVTNGGPRPGIAARSTR